MGNVLPIVGAGLGLFGAIQQQQQAAAATGLSREALELQRQVVNTFLKEMEEMRPYRRAMRELGRQRMGTAPLGWSRWTSDPWRLQPLQLPTPPGNGNGNNGDGQPQQPLGNNGDGQPQQPLGSDYPLISIPGRPPDGLPGPADLLDPGSRYGDTPWETSPGSPFAGVPDSKTGFSGGEGKSGTGGFIDGGKLDFGGGIGKGNGRNGKNGRGGIGDLFSELGII